MSLPVNPANNFKSPTQHNAAEACFIHGPGMDKPQPGNTKGGKYQGKVDLLFDLFGLVCFANKNKNCQLSYS